MASSWGTSWATSWATSWSVNLAAVRSGGGGDLYYENTRRRKPNEPFTTEDDLRAQEKLTEFKALPEEKQEVVAKEAIRSVKEAPNTDLTVDAKSIIEELQTLDKITTHIDNLEVVIMSYFRLQLLQKQRNAEAIMLLMIT